MTDRTAATAHEHAVLDCLRSALHGDRLQGSVDAHQVVAWALTSWAAADAAGSALLLDAPDANAYLAVLRAGVLDTLAACTPVGAPPLADLLSPGGPADWVQPIKAALDAVQGPWRAPETAPAPAADRRGSLGPVASWEDAGPLFAADDAAYAWGIHEVTFPRANGRIQLSPPASRRGDGGWNARTDPQLTVRYPVKGWVAAQETRKIDLPHRRAYAALLAAMFVADRMALRPQRAAFVRRCAREGIGYLLGGFEPGVVIDGFCRVLDKAAEHPGIRWWKEDRLPHSYAWRWPSAHAAVMGAIDRYAGRGAQPWHEEPPSGTWVEVLDDDQTRYRGAWVLTPRGRHHRDDPRRRTGRDGAVPQVWVARAGEEARHVPLDWVRHPRRALLFG